jgi:hypothetical protein
VLDQGDRGTRPRWLETGAVTASFIIIANAKLGPHILIRQYEFSQSTVVVSGGC